MPAISSNKPYRVGRSRTGLGLFATKPIKKGTKIVRYFGPLLDSRDKKHDAIENKYLFELNGRWTIDGSVRKNIARYINHACRPNAESDVSARKRMNGHGAGARSRKLAAAKSTIFASAKRGKKERLSRLGS